jgi:class 3 adenylate cyclase
MTGPSRTNGFLFADLRDYTRYVESRGDRAAAALLETYRELVRATVAAFGGAEIKTEGDSFYVVFPSASSAVQCGLAILEAAVERSTADAPIRVGIGVHAGETVETAEGYVGSAVNVAARVCSQAKAGELLVTDTVRGLTRTFLPVRFTDRRTRRLKGIAEPMVMYRAEPVAEGATFAERRPGWSDRLPNASGIPRAARVGLLLAGLLVGGAIGGYLLVAGQDPEVVPTPSASAAPSLAAADEADAELLAQVPAELQDSCAPTEDPTERRGSVASVRCDLGLAEPADTVWYDQFDSLQQVSNEVGTLISVQGLGRDECDPEISRAQGNWQVGSTHSGRLLCYQADGATWVVWTYDAERILARATRSGDAVEDWVALYEWWEQVRLFLR